MNPADTIKQKALELGFDLAGITDASPIDKKQEKLLRDWLKAGFAGQMTHIARNLENRINPASLLENARSVIVIALNYKPSKNTVKSFHPHAQTGKVAQYAQYEDYHSFIKKRLRRLTNFIISVAGKNPEFKICVGSAPLAEKALAQRAGLGFIGKNHILINHALGPQIFLGEIITDLKLKPDKPITADCAGCSKCLQACPTAALTPDGRLDATRCISYLTIEYKGDIPRSLAEKIGDRIFGCDECVLACPWQKNAPVRKNKHLKFYPQRAELDLHRILSLTERDFDAEFADSPIKRPGLDLLKRNAKICLAKI